MGKCGCIICRSKRRRRSYNVDTRAHDALKPDTMSTASSGISTNKLWESKQQMFVFLITLIPKSKPWKNSSRNALSKAVRRRARSYKQKRNDTLTTRTCQSTARGPTVIIDLFSLRKPLPSVDVQVQRSMEHQPTATVSRFFPLCRLGNRNTRSLERENDEPKETRTNRKRQGHAKQCWEPNPK